MQNSQGLISAHGLGQYRTGITVLARTVIIIIERT